MKSDISFVSSNKWCSVLFIA